jgi:SH3-like domain-containing protein
MKAILKTAALIALISFYLISCNQEKNTDVNQVIETFKTKYASDKRVALWAIQWDGKNLMGETNLKKPLASFLTALDSAGVVYQNQIKLLPDGELEGKEYAIVTISVGNIRSEPKHSAELATQATMGTPLKVLKKQDTWYLIQTPEGYIAWIDAAGIALMTEQEINAWYQKEKAVFTPLFGHVFVSETEAEIVSDLVAGNILVAQNEFQNHLEISLPDGRSGFVRKDQMMAYEEWLATRETSPEKLIQTAKSMIGVPYLWGGTSVKGVDCSGFTKTIFFLNGEIIPRDASQQVHEGEEIDVNKNWKNLEVGDLLFFGSKATADSKERVVHVGMWIGNNSFIHSRGRVRISSFDPASPDYDAYELNRYLRTKRIIGKESKNIRNVEGLFESIPNS